jgi:hypothetical protein
MSGFSVGLDIDGLGAVQQRLADLKEDWDDPPIHVAGSTAEYSVYLEFGTRHMPPYPWLRPAVRELRANPRRFVAKNTQTTIEQVDDADEFVDVIASALETQMKKNVTAQRATGRSPGTSSSHPKVQTGTLRASIKAVQIE